MQSVLTELHTCEDADEQNSQDDRSSRPRRWLFLALNTGLKVRLAPYTLSFHVLLLANESHSKSRRYYTIARSSTVSGELRIHNNLILSYQPNNITIAKYELHSNCAIQRLQI